MPFVHVLSVTIERDNATTNFSTGTFYLLTGRNLFRVGILHKTKRWEDTLKPNTAHNFKNMADSGDAAAPPPLANGVVDLDGVDEVAVVDGAEVAVDAGEPGVDGVDATKKMFGSP